MLCEKCREREAAVKITKVINGVSETHNLCHECAAQLGAQEENTVAEWSKAIFKLLADAAMQSAGRTSDPQQEEMKGIVCPACGKSYGEFLDDGKLGCSDCYEAFEPAIHQAILRLQGAESHTGRKPLKNRMRSKRTENISELKLTREEEIQVLEQEMNQAVSVEDYDSAAKLRDRIKALKENAHE